MALREVFEKIIEAEAQGKRIVERAKGEAERIISQGRREAEQLRARIDVESRAEAERILDAIMRDAEQEKNERMARASGEINAEIQLDEVTRHHAVEAILRCVCPSETDGR